MQLDGGRVKAYQVWAPTDIFFADGSALCALLQGSTFISRAAAQNALHLALLALDPCLPFVTEVNHA